MLTDVKLYGELKDKYGAEFTFDVNSAREVISALIANFKTFQGTLSIEGNQYVLVYDKQELAIDDIMLKTFDKRKVLKIIPVVSGAKSKWASIIIGVVLIYVALTVPGGMASMSELMAGEMASGVAVTGAQYGAAVAFNIGTSMVFSGIAQILAGTPGSATSADKSKNYFFDGPVNTTRQGAPVPIAYGQLMVGGAVINAQIRAEEDQ